MGQTKVKWAQMMFIMLLVEETQLESKADQMKLRESVKTSDNTCGNISRNQQYFQDLYLGNNI